MVKRRQTLNDRKTSRPVQRTPAVQQDSRYHLLVRLIFVVMLLAGVGIALYLVTPGKFTGPSHKKKAASEQFEQFGQFEHFSSEEGNKEERPQDDEVMKCQALMFEAKQLVERSPQTEWDPAIDLLDICARQEPSNSAPRWNLAVILLQMGRTEEALEFMDEALTLDPNNHENLKTSGLLLSQIGLHSRVIVCLEGYLEVTLRVPSWEQLLASISIQREDEWAFLLELEDVIRILEVLQFAYLHEKALIQAGYLYKVIIGLKGEEVELELLSSYAFFAFGLGDFVTGINYLRLFTEKQYILEGYGDLDQAYDVVSAHSLRLFTAGFDIQVTGIGKNLLSGGDAVWEELVYNCKLGPQDAINYTTRVYQSDLRQIFIKCVQMQNIVEHLLEDGAVVYAENHFGWTPLLHAVSIGSVVMVRHLLRKKADPLSRTVLAHTSLHVAAMRGSFNVVFTLIQAGLRANEVDYFNRTALKVACLHSWSAEGLARALDHKLPAKCVEKPIYHPPPRLSMYGGWLSSAFALPQDLTSERCDFDVLSVSDAKTFVFDYLSLQRPVLVRNATSIHVMRKLYQLWKRNKFVNEYGNLLFKVVVPHAESFGMSSSNKTSLKDFLGKMKQFQVDHKHLSIDSVHSPTYIFETISQGSLLLKEFSPPAVLDENITHISHFKLQFYLGPPLSGVPVHFKRSAWNVLIYGQKRWFLYPPDRAFYSKEHVLEWWRDSYRASPDAFECMQYPGDLVFVPDMWGHAFISLREGVSVTSEFIYGGSEFSI